MKLVKQWIQHIRTFWKNAYVNKIFVLLVLTSILSVLLFFYIEAKSANVDALKKGLAQATVIYDRNGEPASKITANKVEPVSIENIPTYVQDAVIAIEDRRFYEHNGIDIKGIVRAFWTNIVHRDIVQGGSTITQQLTKNAFLSSEKTFERKLEELFLAREIEKHYSKKEILEMYLNHIYFGSGAWGIQNAAYIYFGKDLKDVTLSEAALLAGIIKAPSALNPFKHFEKAIERRNVVLKTMYELQMITKEEYETATSEEIVLKENSGDPLKGNYPYYVDAVINEAINKYGLTQEELLTKGYKIYTALDQNIQKGLENVFENDANFPQGTDEQIVQSGAILVDPHTGGVLATVGGRGDHVFRGYHRATQLKAQPGSTFKPIVVYTPALVEGYQVTSMLKDEPMSFGDYTPTNYNGRYEGEVPMYLAVEKSINIPAVWLLNKIGIDQGLDYAEAFGFQISKEDRNLGIALGGLHRGVSPQDLAEAYAVFANGGKRYDSHFITKIVAPDGTIVGEWNEEATQVVEKEIADEMTKMLLNVVETGTGKGIHVDGYTIAGKSGSTQVPFAEVDGTKDQWFVGYTPHLVGAVWLGYDRTDEKHYLKGLSSETVVPLFDQIMEATVIYTPNDPFDVHSVNTYLQKEKKEKNQWEKWIEKQQKKWKKKFEKEKDKWKKYFGDDDD
jgi:penicillin-binding protein 2A